MMSTVFFGGEDAGVLGGSWRGCGRRDGDEKCLRAWAKADLPLALLGLIRRRFLPPNQEKEHDTGDDHKNDQVNRHTVRYLAMMLHQEEGPRAQEVSGFGSPR